MLYVCVREVMDVVVYACIVKHGAVRVVYGKYECFGMQMLYACAYPVAVPNATSCMPCSLLILVEDARGDHIRTTLSPLDLWADPAEVMELMVRWREKLAGGPQA